MPTPHAGGAARAAPGQGHQRVRREAIPMGAEQVMARFTHHPLVPDGCLTPPAHTHMR